VKVDRKMADRYRIEGDIVAIVVDDVTLEIIGHVEEGDTWRLVEMRKILEANMEVCEDMILGTKDPETVLIVKEIVPFEMMEEDLTDEGLPLGVEFYNLNASLTYHGFKLSPRMELVVVLVERCDREEAIETLSQFSDEKKSYEREHETKFDLMEV
jgi:hypothetical protein